MERRRPVSPERRLNEKASPERHQTLLRGAFPPIRIHPDEIYVLLT